MFYYEVVFPKMLRVEMLASPSRVVKSFEEAEKCPGLRISDCFPLAD
jgi:hypothetical protein